MERPFLFWGSHPWGLDSASMPQTPIKHHNQPFIILQTYYLKGDVWGVNPEYTGAVF